jgi:D-proline reductase (dithiol) PrdB
VGIPTVIVMMFKETEKQIRPPRVVHVRFPFGRPLGEPGNADQQRVIIEDSLEALVNSTTPGTVVELPYSWRREDYAVIRRGREKMTKVASGTGSSSDGRAG